MKCNIKNCENDAVANREDEDRWIGFCEAHIAGDEARALLVPVLRYLPNDPKDVH
jgi:hypothetical protein